MTRAVKKIAATALSLTLAVTAMAISVQAAEVSRETHTHVYVWADDTYCKDIDNGEYHQVTLNYRRGKCGCGAVSIDSSQNGQTWLETHTFNSTYNGYPECSECGYVEYASWLPGNAEEEF